MPQKVSGNSFNRSDHLPEGLRGVMKSFTRDLRYCHSSVLKLVVGKMPTSSLQVGGRHKASIQSDAFVEVQNENFHSE